MINASFLVLLPLLSVVPVLIGLGARVVTGSWQNPLLSGMTVFMRGLTLFWIFLHPFIYPNITTSPHGEISVLVLHLLYTAWFVVIPVLCGGILLSNSWKVFCYTYAFLSAIHVWVEGMVSPNIYRPQLFVLDTCLVLLPCSFGLLSVVTTWFFRRKSWSFEKR